MPRCKQRPNDGSFRHGVSGKLALEAKGCMLSGLRTFLATSCKFPKSLDKRVQTDASKFAAKLDQFCILAGP